MVLTWPGTLPPDVTAYRVLLYFFAMWLRQKAWALPVNDRVSPPPLPTLQVGWKYS